MQALALANYLIEESICRRAWISNLQLQKILYFLQLRSLIENEFRHPLIADDFEAWRFGPVVREVYRAYSRNAGLKILRVASSQSPRLTTADVPAWVEPFFSAILQQRPAQLVDLSHRRGGAWQRSYVSSLSRTVPLAYIAEEARQLAGEHIAWLTASAAVPAP